MKINLTKCIFHIQDWSIASWIRVAVLPAGLYTIQNSAALLAYQHLDGITFNVLNQTKTLSAALCCYLLIGRKQSSVQIISLFLLLISALIIENMISIDFLGGGREKTATIIRKKRQFWPVISVENTLPTACYPFYLHRFCQDWPGRYPKRIFRVPQDAGRQVEETRISSVPNCVSHLWQFCPYLCYSVRMANG